MPIGRLGSARPVTARPLAEINVTALVDVLLVLLVIFMLAAPLAQSGLAIDLPASQSASALNPGPNSRQLSLDAQGQLWWGEEAIARHELPGALTRWAERTPDPQLLLRIDPAQAHRELVTLMDVAQQAGVRRIGLVSRKAAESIQEK